MPKEGEVERELGVFMMKAGGRWNLVRDALMDTPPDLTRTVIDLERLELLGVANPPKALLVREGRLVRPMGMDEARSHLAPESVFAVASAAVKAREMREGESVSYEAVYLPPGSPPFRMRMESRPLELDARGRACVVITDVRLEPLT